MTRGQRYATLISQAESRRPSKKFNKNLIVKASGNAGHASFFSLASGAIVESLNPTEVKELIKFLKENFVRRDK